MSSLRLFNRVRLPTQYSALHSAHCCAPSSSAALHTTSSHKRKHSPTDHGYQPYGDRPGPRQFPLGGKVLVVGITILMFGTIMMHQTQEKERLEKIAKEKKLKQGGVNVTTAAGKKQDQR